MKAVGKAEFGDFQTPIALARRVVCLVAKRFGCPQVVLEPTCGKGAFLQAAIEHHGKGPTYYGFEINPDYVAEAKSTVARNGVPGATIEVSDFYCKDWRDFFQLDARSVLVLGNPPWVTSASMGSIGGKNLPKKTNSQGHQGLDAKTGKANFDIAEWMLSALLQSLGNRPCTFAVLCKTATARKVLQLAWRRRMHVSSASLHLIDAFAEFGAAVDACLLLFQANSGVSETSAVVFRSLSLDDPVRRFGLCDGELVSDLDSYAELRDIDGQSDRRWRSGVKHDAATVMEFTRQDGWLVNGLGECTNLESDYVFPLLKSSDLAHGRLIPTRFVLIPQRSVGDDTEKLRLLAPRIWEYLHNHANALDRRASSIYRQRPRFSIFGIGDYSFSSAKVAISGLYKTLVFQALGPFEGKPILLDDTCYFLPCESYVEATLLADLLNSAIAQRFLSSIVFSDAKRPVTVEVLRRINLMSIAKRAGIEANLRWPMETRARGEQAQLSFT